MAVEPIATGTLAKTPLAHLFVYCLDRALTGTLVLQEPEGLRHALYFAAGSPAKVRTGTPYAHLGRILFEIGAIDERTWNQTLAELPTAGELHGELLLRKNLIDRAILRDGLRVQLRRKISHFFTLAPTTLFAFYDQHNLLASWGGSELTPVEPLALLLAAVRSLDPASFMAALDGLASKPLRLHSASQPTRLHPNDRERMLLDALRGRAYTLTNLESLGLASPRETRALVYTLLIARMLDLGEGTKPPVGASRPPPSSTQGMSAEAAAFGSTAQAVARVKLRKVLSLPSLPVAEMHAPGGPRRSEPPRSISSPVSIPVATSVATSVSVAPPSKLRSSPPLSQEVCSQRAEILRRVQGIETEDFYTALGVPPEANPEQIKDAFFALAKRWHPDRLSPEMQDLRDASAKVFARISMAYQTLADSTQRATYDEERVNVANNHEREIVSRIVEASFDYQKAEILLRKGDREGAARYAALAVERDPDQVDYQALRLWISAQDPLVTPEEIARMLKALDQMITRHGSQIRCLWYRGCLLKNLGREDAALRDFRRVVEFDPQHVDAVREIRLYEMRRRGTSGERRSVSPGRPSSPPAAGRSSTPPPPLSLSSKSGEWLGKLFKK